MKRGIAAALVGVTLMSGVAFAKKVRDWKDLHKAHLHLQQVIRELERARAANNYDMQGHGAKAEELARQAEQELAQAVDAIKSEK